MATVNLLNYPALARQRRAWHRRWTSLAGLLVGSLVVVLGLHWRDDYKRHLQQELQRTQAQLNLQKQQHQTAQQRARQREAVRQQLEHLQQVADQHRAWEALHQALQQEANAGGLQLLSLQWVSGRLEMHGRAQDLQRMNQAREHLSQELRLVLDLTRAQFAADARGPSASPQAVSLRPAAGVVEFAWQADWPVMRARREKPVGESAAQAADKALP